MPFNDLLFAESQDNLASIVGELYDIPSADLLTLPVLVAADNLRTAPNSNFVCRSGKKFSRIYFSDQTAKADTKPIGEIDGRGRETTLSARYPKLGSELSNFLSERQNTRSVVLYRMLSTGKLYAIGLSRLEKTSTALSTDIPANFMSGDSSTGEKRGDQTGSLLSWTFSCAHDPIEYVGTIPLTPAP